jgi:hypothetical protein
MSLTTRRQVGGASNLWAGRCVPFDPIDFVARQVTGHASWPVTYDELWPYFARACEWFQCGEALFDALDVPSLAERSLVPGWPGGDIGATGLERWSLPTNFRVQYHERLRAASHVTLVTGLTCTEIVCRTDGPGVSHAIGATLAGGRASIRARRYVIACGGLESTRLLFASNRVYPDGLGNHSGHLGRWYMAHVESHIARIHFATPAQETIYGYERDPDGVYVRRRFAFSPRYAVEHDLPNAALWLDNPELADASHRSGILSLLYLVLASPLGRRVVSEAIRRGQLKTTAPVSSRRHVENVVRHLPSTAGLALALGYRRFLQRGHKLPGYFVASATNTYRLVYHAEHLPNYDSHVVPTSEVDALGVPRLRTHLRFAEADIHNALRAHDHFDRYLRAHRLGGLAHLFGDHGTREAAIHDQLFGGYHQAGTTRMAARPEDGVLDANLAVHGIDDLHVASSSAFVTSSQANTTFMIVVFALRLAEHLGHVLRGPA